MNPSANTIALQSAGTWADERPRPPNLDWERACMQVQCASHPLSIGTEPVVEGSLGISAHASLWSTSV